jgi:hypothetical protein
MAEGHREAARHASLNATSTTAHSTQKGDDPPSPFMRGFTPPLTRAHWTKGFGVMRFL